MQVPIVNLSPRPVQPRACQIVNHRDVTIGNKPVQRTVERGHTRRVLIPTQVDPHGMGRGVPDARTEGIANSRPSTCVVPPVAHGP